VRIKPPIAQPRLSGPEMMPQAGADGSTTMIIGLGLLFIAYVLASFAIIQGLVFPHLAQGPPAAAILLLVVGSYGGGLTLLTMTLLVLYRSEALTPRRSGIALGPHR
jgi:hypothetical protein